MKHGDAALCARVLDDNFGSSPAPVLVAGAGVTGRSVVALLTGCGVECVVADDNAAAREAIAAASGCGTVTVAEALARLKDSAGSAYRLLVASPGWRHEEELVVVARDLGVAAIGDVELAWLLDQGGVFGAPRTWLGITGTNGKTTTTAMAAAMMKEAGFAASAVGNIGVAVTDAMVADPRIDVLVVELSSFQLSWTEKLHLKVGMLLNLAEDHIDWHGSYQDYGLAKCRVLRADQVIICQDTGVDEFVATFPEGLSTIADKVGVSSVTPIRCGLAEPGGDVSVGVSGGNIVSHLSGSATVVAPAEGISPPGPAGLFDAVAAATLSLSAGASPEAIARALAGFEVSAHRGQVVVQTPTHKFIDNSKATNPHAALSAMDLAEPFIWVAGGQLKDADIHELITQRGEKVAAAVVLGVDRQEFVDVLGEYFPNTPVTVIDSTDPVAAMDEAIQAVMGYADRAATVLLAPAAASLDMYSSMSQRGDLFADYARRYTQNKHTS